MNYYDEYKKLGINVNNIEECTNPYDYAKRFKKVSLYDEYTEYFTDDRTEYDPCDGCPKKKK